MCSFWTAEIARAEPVTRLSAGVGGRQYTGSLGEKYALGYVLTAEAAWQPGPLGIGWSALWGSFESEASDNVEETLYTFEMNLGVRGRIPLGGDEVTRALVLRAGVELVRASTPIPPDDETMYWGPAVGATFELVVAEEVIVGIGASYGVIANGPKAITLGVTVGVGSGNASEREPRPAAPAD